jgi:hypothetical protein
MLSLLRILSKRQATPFFPMPSRVNVAVRCAHNVRVIVQQDVPPKAYEGDILHVKAGYARNYLIPQKKAVYATRCNFEKLNIQDPDLETTEQKRDRLAKEAASGEDLDLKASEVLKHYLRNKVVRAAYYGRPTSRSKEALDRNVLLRYQHTHHHRLVSCLNSSKFGGASTRLRTH